MQETIIKLAQQIKLIIFDVDGVLTDGKLYFGDAGEIMKAFHSLDGIGIKMLLNNDIEVALITGRQSKIVSARADELGIKHLYQGQLNKLNAFADCLAKLNVAAANTAYMGDDIIDLPVMQQVCLSIAPANALDEVKSNSIWVTKHHGGDGAVREVCNTILKAQHKWQQAIKAYGN